MTAVILQTLSYSFDKSYTIDIVSPPPGSWGMIFVSSARQGGATAKLQEPGWGHIQWVEDDYRQSSRGGTALS